MQTVVLMGFMGAGKTTVGKCLAEKLSCEFLDTDECIEAAEGREISEIFASDGETVFRDMETELLKALKKRETPFVLSVGGGMPVREENRALLRSLGMIVYLKASKETIMKRVAGDSSRPLLQGGALEEKITSLMQEREQIYMETADRIMETDGRTPEELSEDLCSVL